MPFTINPEAAYNNYFGSNATKRRTKGSIKNYLKNRSEQDQYELDVAMWYGTFWAPNFSQDGKKFLRRLWFTIIKAGMFCDEGGGYVAWNTTGVPVAACLSHGGRVMIQLPPGDTGRAYWNWLTQDTGVHRRVSGTHGLKPLSPGERKSLARSRRVYLKETGGSSGGGRYLHYCLNIPLGGWGEYNPFSGKRITDNGEHGHMYIGYLEPQTGVAGGVLVGCEGSEPIDQKHPNSYKGEVAAYLVSGGLASTLTKGKVDIGSINRPDWAVDQTGNVHRLGESGEFSPTGGMKWKKKQWHTRGPISSKNGMIIDLVSTGWEWLIPIETSMDDFHVAAKLGDAGEFRDQPPIYTGVGQKEWKMASSAFRSDFFGNSKSVPILKNIDKLVMQLESQQMIKNKQTQELLLNIADECCEWLRVKARKHNIKGSFSIQNGSIFWPQLMNTHPKYKPMIDYLNRVMACIEFS